MLRAGSCAVLPASCLVVPMAGTPMNRVFPASSWPMSAAAIAPTTAPLPRMLPGMMTAVTPKMTCRQADLSDPSDASFRFKVFSKILMSAALWRSSSETRE